MSKGKGFLVHMPGEHTEHRSISPVPADAQQQQHVGGLLEVVDPSNGGSPLMSSRQKAKKSFRHTSSVLNDHFLPAAAQRPKPDVLLPNVCVLTSDLELVVQLLRFLDNGLKGTITAGANPTGPLLEGRGESESSGIAWAPLYETQYAVQGWSLVVDAIGSWWSGHTTTPTVLVPSGVADIGLAALLFRL